MKTNKRAKRKLKTDPDTTVAIPRSVHAAVKAAADDLGMKIGEYATRVFQGRIQPEPLTDSTRPVASR